MLCSEYLDDKFFETRAELRETFLRGHTSPDIKIGAALAKTWVTLLRDNRDCWKGTEGETGRGLRVMETIDLLAAAVYAGEDARATPQRLTCRFCRRHCRMVNMLASRKPVEAPRNPSVAI